MASPPVDKVRDGALEAAIWQNQGPDGSTYYTVSINRSYKDSNNEWQQTSQLRKHDLLTQGELLRLAWYKIRALEAGE